MVSAIPQEMSSRDVSGYLNSLVFARYLEYLRSSRSASSRTLSRAVRQAISVRNSGVLSDEESEKLVRQLVAAFVSHTVRSMLAERLLRDLARW